MRPLSHDQTLSRTDPRRYDLAHWVTWAQKYMRLHIRQQLGRKRKTVPIWVAKSLKEMESIKADMTRADLLRVFMTEGGLSTGLRRTYVYCECPLNMKVPVSPFLLSLSGAPKTAARGLR